jgi:hypothetical protein
MEKFRGKDIKRALVKAWQPRRKSRSRGASAAPELAAGGKLEDANSKDKPVAGRPRPTCRGGQGEISAWKKAAKPGGGRDEGSPAALTSAIVTLLRQARGACTH